jgi:hypothetical protein
MQTRAGKWRGERATGIGLALWIGVGWSGGAEGQPGGLGIALAALEPPAVTLTLDQVQRGLGERWRAMEEHQRERDRNEPARRSYRLPDVPAPARPSTDGVEPSEAGGDR